VFRAGFESGDVEFVAVNDLADAKTIAHLLKYDSTHGTLRADVKSTPNAILVDGREIRTFSVRDPEELPWRDWRWTLFWKAPADSRTGTARKSISKQALKKSSSPRPPKIPM